MQSIYDKKRMKNVRQTIVQDNTPNNNKHCKSLYHQKLTDNFKSNS